MQLEEERLWPRVWTSIGLGCEIPNPGDMLPYTLGTLGIHVERLPDGDLVARLNRAQHGGCVMVPLQCRSGQKIRCGFTSCGYSLDRAPMPAPPPGQEAPERLAFSGARPDNLARLAVCERQGILFVHAGTPKAAPILPSGMPDWHSASAAARMIIPRNWKDIAPSLGSLVQEWTLPNLVHVQNEDGPALFVLQPIAPARTSLRLYTRVPDSQAASEFWRQQLSAPGGPENARLRDRCAAWLDPLLAESGSAARVQGSAYPRNTRYNVVVG